MSKEVGNRMRSGFAALLIAVVVAVTACTGSAASVNIGPTVSRTGEPASAPPNSQAVVQAAVATALRTSAVVHTTSTLSQSGGETYTLTTDGQFDFAANQGTLTVRLPGGAIDRLREIFIPATVYVDALANLPAGHWAAAPRDTLKAHHLLRARANDPGDLLRQLARAERVSVVGADTAHGVPTTHYRGYLNEATYSMYLSDTAKQQAQQVARMLGSDAVLVNAWIDRTGALHRSQFKLSAAGIGVTMDLNLSDYGTPVTATPPARQLLVPVNDLGGALVG